MVCGGNGRARTFFKQHGWADAPGAKMEQKYTSRAAELYRQTLAREATALAAAPSSRPASAAPGRPAGLTIAPGGLHEAGVSEASLSPTSAMGFAPFPASLPNAGGSPGAAGSGAGASAAPPKEEVHWSAQGEVLPGAGVRPASAAAARKPGSLGASKIIGGMIHHPPASSATASPAISAGAAGGAGGAVRAGGGLGVRKLAQKVDSSLFTQAPAEKPLAPPPPAYGGAASAGGSGAATGGGLLAGAGASSRFAYEGDDAGGGGAGPSPSASSTIGAGSGKGGHVSLANVRGAALGLSGGAGGMSGGGGGDFFSSFGAGVGGSGAPSVRRAGGFGVGVGGGPADDGEAQRRFAGAKAISSSQFSARDDAADARERDQRMSRFAHAGAISRRAGCREGEPCFKLTI